MVPYLQESLHRTLGELSDPQLYNVSMVGTKHLVENYLDEIESNVDYLCDTDFDFIDNRKKRLLFKHSGKNFGRSALMLSAGGAFGICHFGVIRTLIQHQLLPEVIAGSSMGAIVAGFIGTHSDQQILKILSEPENQHFMPISWRKLSAMLGGESLMQPDQLMECNMDIFHKDPSLFRKSF